MQTTTSPPFEARETDSGWVVYDHRRWRQTLRPGSERHARDLTALLTENPAYVVTVEWSRCEVAA